jgi:predicted O-methyltransferase YrrM
MSTLKKISIVRSYLRYKFAKSYYKEILTMMRRWAIQKTENDNFYYELTEKNRKDLVSMLSMILNISTERLNRYHEEIINNFELRNQIENILKNTNLADIRVGFGRREAWYLITRVMKPKIVIETGVHHGVGACVITSALKKNHEEGFQGKYIGIDIDVTAGILLKSPLNNYGSIIYSDSLEALRQIDEKIDIFINDSDHSVDYEEREYELINNKLSDKGIILGDNSHANSVLRDFSNMSNRNFVFFKEEPADHWYPGAGVGISIPKII